MAGRWELEEEVRSKLESQEASREEGLREKKLHFHSPGKAVGTDGLSTDNVLSSLVI